MKRHVLIHTNIRAYQCHLCFKSFVQKQTLKAHMIVHSDVKPFKCKLCGKEFNRMHNLMGHMHLHSDSKPFKCIYCSSKFTLKGNLTRHMKVKHGIMERGPHSRGLGRGRTELPLPSDSRGLEQKEPFDLSQKRREKQETSLSDGESALESSCPEEESEHGHSPGLYHYSDKVHCSEELSGSRVTVHESDHGEKAGSSSDGHDPEGEEPGDYAEDKNRRELPEQANSQTSKHFDNKRLFYSSNGYLFYKHRKGSFKQVLKRKAQFAKPFPR